MQLASQLKSAWRLTNTQQDCIAWINSHWQTLVEAGQRNWSEIQPLLINANAQAALEVANAIDGLNSGIKFCQARLEWSREQLDPAPLLDGQDLIELGITPGPRFKSLLQAIRDGQLDGELATVADAKQFVQDNAR